MDFEKIWLCIDSFDIGCYVLWWIFWWGIKKEFELVVVVINLLFWDIIKVFVFCMFNDGVVLIFFEKVCFNNVSVEVCGLVLWSSKL